MCAALAFTVGPATAQAATVQVIEPKEPHSGPYVEFKATPGEVNRVTAVKAPGGLRITDRGATLVPGHGCTAVASDEVVCETRILDAELGDGDDTLSAPAVAVRGGEGDDTLTGDGSLAGGPGDDELRGGARRDSLDGGGGSDSLHGGAGPDYLSDGDNPENGIGPDLIDGGPGTDTAAVQMRTTPVAVDLERAGGQGVEGEGDTFAGIENVSADAAGSRLYGDDGANRLGAYGGSNVIDGRGGNDSLDGSSDTRDTLIGGRGDDSLILGFDPYSATSTDSISCGPGRDIVRSPVPLQLVPANCEKVGYDDDSYPSYVLHRRMRSAEAVFAAVAPGWCSAQRTTRCTVVWSARRANGAVAGAGPLLARRIEFTRPMHNGERVGLRLTPAGRRLIRREHALRLRVGMLRHGKLRGGFEMRVHLPAQP